MFIRGLSFSLTVRVLAGMVALALGGGPALRAVDQAPVVGPGATREEVIDAYGWPNGSSQAGTKEILTYPQGRITLESGRVERVDFSPDVPWPAPRPRPGPPTASTAPKPDAPPDFWLQNLEDAQREARRRNARILALFVGSDWSPPSRQFLEEVAFHPDFVNTFTGDFVFLRLDFPTRTAQPPETREQNARLRATYEVTTYPTLLVLSSTGTLLANIDLAKPQPGDTYLARIISAVREVRDYFVAQPPPPEPEPVAAPAVAPDVAAAPSAAPPPATVESPVRKAFKLIMGALVTGLALVALGWWFLWRPRRDNADGQNASRMAARISNAASGLPPEDEILAWPKERLTAVVARLAEAEGYQVRPRAGGGDGDLALLHGGQTNPGVIVNCLPGGLGAAPAKRLRELFGTITVEGVKTGWFVSPAGFSREARDYAAQHDLVLIGVEQLLGQMRAVPPIMLQKILAE